MRLTGFIYRAHNPRWAFAPDSGQGAAFAGGRFNSVGMPALYTSLRFETAWLEAQQAFRIARESRRKNFDGYVAVESRVMSTIHLTHATSAERRLDLIGPEFGA